MLHNDGDDNSSDEGNENHEGVPEVADDVLQPTTTSTDTSTSPEEESWELSLDVSTEKDNHDEDNCAEEISQRTLQDTAAGDNHAAVTVQSALPIPVADGMVNTQLNAGVEETNTSIEFDYSEANNTMDETPHQTKDVMQEQSAEKDSGQATAKRTNDTEVQAPAAKKKKRRKSISGAKKRRNKKKGQ